MKSWKRKWVRLTKTDIYVFDSPTKNSPILTIPLQRTVVSLMASLGDSYLKIDAKKIGKQFIFNAPCKDQADRSHRVRNAQSAADAPPLRSRRSDRE